MTLGEFRTGVKFNPNNATKVDEIKKLSAQLIDCISTIHDGSAVDNHQEVKRLKAISITKVEESAMWGVKAATKHLIKE